MKILYLPKSPVPSTAANSVHVMKMAQALGRLGHSVTVLSPEHRRKERFPRIPDIYHYYGVQKVFKYWRLLSFGKKNLRKKLALFLLRLILRLGSPDLVFSRSLDGALAGLGLQISTLFECHDSFSDASENNRKAFLEIIRHPCLKKIIVISQALKNELCDKFSIEEEKILVCPDGADINDALPALPKSEKLRIGYTGHLYQGRGIDIIGNIASHLQDYEFHIIGGKKEDINFWTENFKNTPNIILHGHISPSLIPMHLKSFDILLAPYQKKVSVAGKNGGEGDSVKWMSPLKIFEYMAAGKPMICSDLPVLREILKDGENCLLCVPDDTESWIERIRYLAGNPDVRKRLADSAFSEIEKKYSWTARCSYIISHFDR